MNSYLAYVKIAFAALIAAVVYAAFGGTLDYGFHWDDVHAILKNPAIRSPEAALYSFIDPRGFSAFRLAMVRPLTVMSYALNYRIGEFNPLGWHIFNLSIHFLASLSVMGVVSRLSARSKKSGVMCALGGLAAGLLFAAHPLQSETLNYFSARSALMAGMFCLAGLYFHLLWSESGRVHNVVIATALFICGTLCRESAAVFPAAALLTDLLAPISKKEKITDTLKKNLPYWIALAAYMAYRFGVLGTVTREGGARGPIEQLVIDIWAVGLYHYLLFLPWKTTVRHTALPGFHTLVLLWVGAGAMAAQITAAIYFLRKKPLPFLGIGLFYLGLLPTLVFSLNVHASEHRLYFAMLGPAILLGWMVSGIKRNVIGYITGATLLVGLTVLTFVARADAVRWENEVSLWRKSVSLHPNDDVSWNLYGKSLKDAGDLSGAIIAYRASIAINPTGGAYNNLSVACGLVGDSECARNSLEKAVEIEPDNPQALMNMGIVLMQRGETDAAERYLREAIKSREVFPEAHRNLAVVLLSKKPPQQEEALHHIEKSLDQDPFQDDADFMRKAAEQLKFRINSLK